MGKYHPPLSIVTLRQPAAPHVFVKDLKTKIDDPLGDLVHLVQSI